MSSFVYATKDQTALQRSWRNKLDKMLLSTLAKPEDNTTDGTENRIVLSELRLLKPSHKKLARKTFNRSKMNRMDNDWEQYHPNT